MIISLLLASFLQSPAQAAPLKATFHNPKGEEVGIAHIDGKEKGVTIKLELKKLPPGAHAFHVHEKGSCKAPDFASAGAHYNPSKAAHGFQSDNGPHAGDFENITVREDGTLEVELSNDRLDLGKSSLRKKGGTALVIHEKGDDYKSQPAGDAGGRIACAEIR